MAANQSGQQSRADGTAPAGIHIGSGVPLDFFTSPRAWDLARNRPLTDDQPAEVRARITERANERVQAFKAGPLADWFNHVNANANAHDHGCHFIPWENPDARVSDLRRTFWLQARNDSADSSSGRQVERCLAAPATARR